MHPWEKLVNSFPFFSYSLDYAGRCRWSTNTGESLLFVKYDDNILNILDVDKQVFILKEPVQLDPGNCSSRNFALFSLRWSLFIMQSHFQ